MANNTTPPFELSRVTPADMSEIITQACDIFSAYTVQAAFGVKTPEDIPKYVAYAMHQMETDTSDLWIKATDAATGKIAAALKWNLFLKPANKYPSRGRDEVPSWLEGEEARNESRLFIEGMNEARLRYNPGPFLHLHVLFTVKEYRRRGAAAMMVKWGVELADSLFLPMFVESSKDGQILYEQFGFYDTGEQNMVNGEPRGIFLKRDARSTAITGGRTLPTP